MSDPAQGDGNGQRARPVQLARVLAASGGFVDAVGYVALFRLFTAHQSGNSDGLGVAIAIGKWATAWQRFSPIGAFVVGVLLGTIIVEQIRRVRPRWSGPAVAVAELFGLAVALGVGTTAAVGGKIAPADTSSYAAAATALGAAMGFQNVLLRRVGSDRTPTTFVTGILTAAAELLVVGLHQRGTEERRATLRRSGFLGSLWLVYLLGAIAGGGAETAWGFAALAAPMAVVAGVVVWQVRAGYEPSLAPTSPPAPPIAGGGAGESAMKKPREA
ncbi:MAG TPA: YoaK family protein [Acidimicrobiales bacterium]|nr:YoaK family protein [Acidimicrobiales bacterium]